MKNAAGIFYTEQGEGITPIVCLHGIGGDASSFQPQLVGLSDDHRVISWCMPGYGGSESLEPLTFESLAAKLCDFLDALNIQTAHLCGQSIGGMRADQVAYLGIALVPEGRQLFPSLSVEENLRLGGTVGRTGPWSLEKVYELFPVLKERRTQASTSLSGGQQQMVAIGRALMSNPDLILFDEISLGLAPVIIKNIYDALPNIIDEGMTAMIVEQDITKALAVSSRVYCLQEGRVSLEGRTGEVSRDEITAAYFGVET